MRNQIDEYSFTDFPEGYGEFPYIVLRITYAIYMQIPIHFIPEGEIGDPSVQRGTHITDVSPSVLKLPKNEQIKVLHEKMLEQTSWIKNKVESERKVKLKVALVEGPEECYHFDEQNVLTVHHQIPSGGTLLDQELRFIAYDAPHYNK